MKRTELIMGMPIVVEVAEKTGQEPIDDVLTYFRSVDEKFSPFKPDSEVSQLNSGDIGPENMSADLKTVLELAEQTKRDTNGYFDIQKSDGRTDPSGLVKGWAIQNAAKILKQAGLKNFYIEAGGDVEISGTNENQSWVVGIKNPFNHSEIVKVLYLTNQGIATSGTYEKGQHIYNPHLPNQSIHDIVSLTVIGPNVYEADRYATAAFAMGRAGIQFIESLPGFEGYMIDSQGFATETSGFKKFTEK